MSAALGGTAAAAGDPREAAAGERDSYRYWLQIPTRWMDTDGYGHVNNAQYYSYFDTLVTSWLIAEGGRDPGTDAEIGLCVESQCRFHAPLEFPQTIGAGLRVGRLGRSSVRYEIALYAQGPEHRRLAASGHFVHVYVDRELRTPVPIPPPLRDRLARLAAETPRP